MRENFGGRCSSVGDSEAPRFRIWEETGDTYIDFPFGPPTKRGSSPLPVPVRLTRSRSRPRLIAPPPVRPSSQVLALPPSPARGPEPLLRPPAAQPSAASSSPPRLDRAGAEAGIPFGPRLDSLFLRRRICSSEADDGDKLKPILWTR